MIFQDHTTKQVTESRLKQKTYDYWSRAFSHWSGHGKDGWDFGVGLLGVQRSSLPSPRLMEMQAHQAYLNAWLFSYMLTEFSKDKWAA